VATVATRTPFTSPSALRSCALIDPTAPLNETPRVGGTGASLSRAVVYPRATVDADPRETGELAPVSEAALGMLQFTHCVPTSHAVRTQETCRCRRGAARAAV
jgi:hypothetical protein